MSLELKMVVALVILFMFFSVIISSYLIHKKDNVAARGYYLVSCLWAGLLVNFCLMALVILILKSIGWVFGFSIPLSIVKLIFFGGTFLFSFWGVCNAWFPGVITYEVKIKDLPESWNNKVVVQISDVHLGPVYRKKFFYRLIEQINKLTPEAVFITGDLFDGMEAEFSWMNHPFNNLKAPRGAYYSYGNHDLYLGYNRVKSLLKDNPIKILNNKMEIIDGLQVIGINYSFNNDFDLEEAILKQVDYDSKKPSILLFHAPRNINLAKKVGIDLQLSGHTHDGQMFPYNLFTKWAHGGYSYGFFRKGDFTLIVSAGVGSWGPPMRTSSRSEIVQITLKKKQDKS